MILLAKIDFSGIYKSRFYFKIHTMKNGRVPGEKLFPALTVSGFNCARIYPSCRNLSFPQGHRVFLRH